MNDPDGNRFEPVSIAGDDLGVVLHKYRHLRRARTFRTRLNVLVAIARMQMHKVRSIVLHRMSQGNYTWFGCLKVGRIPPAPAPAA